MSHTNASRNRAGAPLAFAALALALLLGACSDRDTELSEAIAAAEQSANRAEKAAVRAEEAANKAGPEPAPTVAAEEEEPADEADKALAEQNEPPASEPSPGT